MLVRDAVFESAPKFHMIGARARSAKLWSWFGPGRALSSLSWASFFRRT